MPPVLTQEHFRHVFDSREKLAKRFTDWKEKHKIEQKTGRIIGAAEMLAGVAAGGLIQGRSGPDGLHIVGIPAEAAAGGVIAALAVFDAMGQYSEHALNFGVGLMGAALANVTYSMGRKWHETGHLFGQKDQASLPAAHSAGAFSPDQMSALQQMIHPAG